MGTKKLKVLVITMGGDRKKNIEDMFSSPAMAEHFEPPTFSEGVSSRYIRNRFNFFKVANDAGLLPEQEWKTLLECTNDGRYYGKPTERFFDCLADVEVTKGRQGSSEDTKIHYSVELWRKAKAINRGRSVLACVFAHLIAMKTFVADGTFDLILEDNVRIDPKRCPRRVRDCSSAAREWEEISTNNSSPKCHFRFVGWLGSIPNLEWILQTHVPKRKYIRKRRGDIGIDFCDDKATICPLPLLEHLEEDILIAEKVENIAITADGPYEKKPNTTSQIQDGNSETNAREVPNQHNKPGGNLLWGAYAYWISMEAYDALMATLRSDVGAMLWKGKRMRNYTVKPIDKILPRQTLANFGPGAVQITSRPAFFRAPMLTSKIHSKWDPGFCDSTSYQLHETQLSWSDLWLTDVEREIVKHHKTSGKWLTITELESLQPKHRRLSISSYMHHNNDTQR